MKSIAAALVTLLLAGAAPAAGPPALDGDGFAARFRLLGQVQPRDAHAVSANDWSVGGEAQDRDYSTFAKWRAYLAPLGVKRIRLQSGWNRTDQGQGRYDFAWLDPVIDGVLAEGVQPWLSLSYGNPRYPGGGTLRRDTPLPTGEGLTAWLAYVTAVATRYRGKVPEYELWNEPNINANITAEGYGAFAYATAKAIRAADPRARIIFGAFAGVPWPGEEINNPEFKGRPNDFAKRALVTYLKLGGKAEALTYHSYAANPDAVYANVDRLVAGVHALDPKIEVRQGENGAPSLNQPHYALRNMWWTEQSQAKWMLRRMMGDAARGIPTSVFTITEMHYPVEAETGLAFHNHDVNEKAAASTAKHMKGLLETRLYAPGTAEDDRTVVRTKMIYPAIQAVTAIFDATLRPVAGACTVTGASGNIVAHLFRRADGASVIAAWRADDIPDVNTAHVLADIRCAGARFRGAVTYVDLLTRAAYATDGVAGSEGGAIVATGVPVYDSPVLLADTALIHAR